MKVGVYQKKNKKTKNKKQKTFNKMILFLLSWHFAFIQIGQIYFTDMPNYISDTWT